MEYNEQDFEGARVIDLDMSGLEDDPIESPNNPYYQQASYNEPDPESVKFEEDDMIGELLKLKGITDPNKIKIEDETGAVIETPWNQLSREEQLAVLHMDNSDPETALDDEEIEMINAIRKAGLNPAQYLEQIRQEAVKGYQQVPQYKIDDLSDDELFALDLMQKVGSDISEEDLQNELDYAKQNEDLYQKKVTALRNYYHNLEDQEKTRREKEVEEQRNAQYNQFADQVLNHIQDFSNNSGYGIQLDTREMNELANFMITRDETGMTEFGRMLNDPKAFTNAAFWALKGPEILHEFQEQMQEQFKRGYAMGQNRLNNSKVTVTTPGTKPRNQRTNTLEISDYNESYLD